MASCGVCGERSTFAYTCKRCAGEYCVHHRLPEKHVCSGYVVAEPSESEDASTMNRRKSGPEAMQLDEIHRQGAGPDVSTIGERSPDVNLDGSIKRDDESPDGQGAETESTGVVGRIRALFPF